MLEMHRKDNPPKIDGDMKKSKQEEDWLLGMKMFFRTHDYYENMKAKISTYSLKGKVETWWKDWNNGRGIVERDLVWHEFEKLLGEKYRYEHYYDRKDKELYELKMGKLSDDEYVTKFLVLLRYVPYY